MLPALFLCFLCYSVTLQHDFLCEGFLETSSGCRGYLAIFSNATLLAGVEFHGIPPSETRGWCHGFLCSKAEFLFFTNKRKSTLLMSLNAPRLPELLHHNHIDPANSCTGNCNSSSSPKSLSGSWNAFFFMRSFSKVAHSNTELAAQNNKCH